MVQFLLVALLVMALFCAAATFAAVMQNKRAKAVEEQYKDLREAFWQAKEKAERLQKALGETSKVEDAANAERKELAQTADSDLVNRANGLFK